MVLLMLPMQEIRRSVLFTRAAPHRRALAQQEGQVGQPLLDGSEVQRLHFGEFAPLRQNARRHFAKA